ncbi:MAG TPA: hypothetical protein P5048_03010 [Chlamydiales bacterium]|nr:hypothetical protein [Chlamydiales bacterium]
MRFLKGFFIFTSLMGFLFFGIGFLMLGISENFHMHALSFGLEHAQVIKFFGLFLISIFLVSVGLLYYFHRHRFFVIKMGENKAKVDIKLIETALQDYFVRTNMQFSKVSLLFNQKLQIHLAISSLEKENADFQKVEEEVSSLLEGLIGYQKEFLLHLEIY